MPFTPPVKKRSEKSARSEIQWMNNRFVLVLWFLRIAQRPLIALSGHPWPYCKKFGLARLSTHEKGNNVAIPMWQWGSLLNSTSARHKTVSELQTMATATIVATTVAKDILYVNAWWRGDPAVAIAVAANSTTAKSCSEPESEKKQRFQLPPVWVRFHGELV